MKLKLILGPCVIEGDNWPETWLVDIAGQINEYVEAYNQRQKDNQELMMPVGPEIDFYFKSSFDKANRTSVDSYRGPGIDAGLKALQKVKDTYGCKILTDIHEPWQATQIAEVADVIQIPAFLCRQTDLLVAAAQAAVRHPERRIVNIKKGQNHPSSTMRHGATKCLSTGLSQDDVWLTERGSMYGYGDLIVDMRNLVEMKKIAPVIFDATHSVQQPGGSDGTTGGNREMVIPLLRAACATGVDGLFLEVHPDPKNAKSDAGSQYYLDNLPEVFQVIERYTYY